MYLSVYNSVPSLYFIMTSFVRLQAFLLLAGAVFIYRQ